MRAVVSGRGEPVREHHRPPHRSAGRPSIRTVKRFLPVHGWCVPLLLRVLSLSSIVHFVIVVHGQFRSARS